jgi:hypothetical protein
MKEKDYCGSQMAQIVVEHMAVGVEAAYDFRAIDRRYVAEKLRDMADILEKRKATNKVSSRTVKGRNVNGQPQ